MSSISNNLSFAMWRDSREEEGMKNLRLSRSPYVSSECENHMMTTQVEALPFLKPPGSFQSIIGSGEQMFFQELKPVVKEGKEHVKNADSSSLSKMRLEGLNNSDANLETSVSDTSSPQIPPERTSTESNLLEENHTEASEVVTSANDADMSIESEQNPTPDQGSDKKKGKRSR
jgi:hypothetical protein